MPAWAVALTLWLLVMLPAAAFVGKMIKTGRDPGT